jgi:uncharacterized membrane protein
MTFDTINRLAVLATTALLGVGLGVWVVRGDVAASRILDTGLIVLMLTPVLRLVTTLAEAVRERDTTSVLTTLAVFGVLALTLTLTLALRW